MPAQVDGEVRIGVRINTSNVKQDAERLKKSVESIFSSYAKDSKSANANLMSLQNQMRKYADALNKARAEQEKIGKTEVYSDRYKQMQSDLDKTNKYIEKTKASLTSLQAKERELGKRVIPTPEYQSAIDKTKAYEAELTRLDERFRKIDLMQKQYLARARVPEDNGGLGLTESEAKASKEYKAFDKQLDKINQQRNALYELRRVALAAQLELENTGSAFQSNKSALATGDAVKEYTTLANKIKEVETNLSNAQQRADAYNKTLTSNTFRKENITAGVATQEYANATNQVENLENKLAELVNKYNQLKTTVKPVGPMLKNAFVKAKDAIVGLIGRLKSLRRESKGSFGDMAKSAKMSFMKILKYAFGIRSIYALVRRLRSAFTEGMKVMGSNFPEIQAQLDSLSASFTQLKFSLATAFQPIFSVALPALNALMSALVSAMNTLANFFATLTGQKYIYKATKANNALADSYGGAGGAAKDAAEDIAEYDKLIVINQDKAGGGGGGGGAGDANAGAFEKVPAEQSRLAQLIKEAWKESDFTDVGTYIGEKLNEGLQNIPWDKIKQTASNLGKDLATLINGFVEVPDLGYNIGKTIAEGFNTGLEFFYSFVTNFHWDSVGKFIGDGINGALLNFDWTKLGYTIASGINGAVSTVKTLLTTLDVEGIATNIGNGISEFLRTLDTKEIAETIHLLITKALTGAVALLKSIDFKELGRKLGDFLAGLDIPDLVSKMAKLAWTILTAIGDAILGFIESNPLAGAIVALLVAVKVSDAGSTIAGNVISGMLTRFTTSAASGGTLAQCFSSMFSPAGELALLVAAGLVGWHLGNKLYDGLTKDKNGDNVIDKMVADIGYAITGNNPYFGLTEDFNWASDKLKELTGHTKELGDATKEVGSANKDTASKTKKAHNTMDSAIEGTTTTQQESAEIIIQGAKDMGSAVGGFFSDTIEQAQDSSTKVQTAFDKAKTKIGTTVSTATTNWITKWKTSIETTKTNLENSTKTMSSNMLTSIKGVFKDTGLISTVNSLASHITNAMTGSATASSTGFLTGFNSAFSSANTTANTTANNITTKFSKTGTSVQSSLTGAWSTITKAFNNGKALTDSANTISSKFSTVASSIQSVMSGAWKGIVNAFNSNQVNIKVSNSLANSINGAIDGLVRGVNSALYNGFTNINNFIDKLNRARAGGSVTGFAMGMQFAHIPIPSVAAANGVVIPPNKEFLALLGDQTQGTNIETPLATMLEAFNKALDTRGGSNNAPVVLQLNGRDIARAVWDENEKKYKQVGKYGTKFA